MEGGIKEYSIPTNPTKPIIAGVLVIVLAIGGFGVWAVLSPLSKAVVAPGVVKVDSNRKQIQHLEGGVVKEILVHDGDEVKAGDVLVRLDKTRAEASLTILDDGFNSAIAQRARLASERDKLERVKFPEFLVKHQDNVKISEILKTQEALFKARRMAVRGQVRIIKKQIANLREDASGLRAQKAAKTRQIGFTQDELKSLQELLKKGLTGKQRVLELEREVARLEGEYGEHVSAIAAVGTAIAEKELEIYQVENAFQENIANELKQVQTEIYDYQERINAADHVFEQTVVRSPVDGVVMDSGVHTIGGVVGPGEVLLEIVPGKDKLIVEARIDPKDIDDIQAGLPAGIKITAFNQRNTPELQGKLSYVSADALQDEQTGQTFFIAKVHITESELKRLKDQQLQPGMMAEVFIRTGERTPADYLIQPLRDSFRRAWLEE